MTHRLRSRSSSRQLERAARYAAASRSRAARSISTVAMVTGASQGRHGRSVVTSPSTWSPPPRLPRRSASASLRVILDTPSARALTGVGRTRRGPIRNPANWREAIWLGDQRAALLAPGRRRPRGGLPRRYRPRGIAAPLRGASGSTPGTSKSWAISWSAARWAWSAASTTRQPASVRPTRTMRRSGADRSVRTSPRAFSSCTISETRASGAWISSARSPWTQPSVPGGPGLEQEVVLERAQVDAARASG